MVGGRDPEQVNAMAKQAGEVCTYYWETSLNIYDKGRVIGKINLIVSYKNYIWILKEYFREYNYFKFTIHLNKKGLTIIILLL